MLQLINLSQLHPLISRKGCKNLPPLLFLTNICSIVYMVQTPLQAYSPPGPLDHAPLNCKKSCIWPKMQPQRSSPIILNVSTVCLKKCTNFEMVQLKIIRINFDEIWQKYSKASAIEFACFSFHVDLLFLINFLSFKPDTKNNTNFDAVGLTSKRGNFDAIQ